MRRLWLGFGLASGAVGLAATAFWLFYGRPAAFAPPPLAIQVGAVAGLSALTVLNLVTRWLRWQFLMRRFVRGLPTRSSLKLYFGTLPAFATPLYLGELVRTAIVARREPRARRAVVWVWVAERLGDAGALALFLLIALELWGALAAVVGGGAVLVVWLISSREATESAGPVARVFRRPRVLGAIAAGSVWAWLLPVWGLWLLLRLLGEPISAADAGEVFPTATFLGGISLLPLGSGVTGSSMILHLDATGVAPETAVLAVALFRAGTSWFALGLGLLSFAVWRRDILSLARAPTAAAHFQALASEYDEQLPHHVRERVVMRKVQAMEGALPPPGPHVCGLEIGCGHGWYTARLERLGYAMHACDVAAAQVAQARKFLQDQGLPARVQVADARALPFGDASFEFAYAVNVLHHVEGRGGRAAALSEIVRVLKPGGRFFLHEINTANPLFALYMGYAFPVLRDIDDGTEGWIKPRRLPHVDGALWEPELTYMTFLPDFTPRRLLAPLTPLERALEHSSLRQWSAHYTAVLVKQRAGPS